MKKIFHKLTFLLIGIFVLLQSCSGDSSGDTPSTTPTNLKVTTEIVGTTTANPNGNGSGTVIFKATATNATTYQILIEGKTLVMTNGELTYTFATAGTNTFPVIISAYNAGRSVSAN